MDKLHPFGPTVQISGCVWNDAHGSDGTISVHEIDHKPYVYTTVGFLLRSDEIGVSIASEMGEDGKFRDITFIPRAMVVKEFPISPKRKPNVKKAKTSSPPTSPIHPSPNSTGKIDQD
jgi:hypothetical protein